MVSVLLVTVSLSAVPPGRAAVSISDTPLAYSARLLAQAAPTGWPPGVQPDASRVLQLEAELRDLNSQLSELSVAWPAGAIAMSVIGWVISPASLVGLMLLFLAIFAPALVVPAVASIIIGLVGVGLGIAGIVVGATAASRATAERDDLDKRRRQLEDELRSLRGSSGGMDRSFGGSPRLITLGSF